MKCCDNWKRSQPITYIVVKSSPNAKDIKGALSGHSSNTDITGGCTGCIFVRIVLLHLIKYLSTTRYQVLPCQRNINISRMGPIFIWGHWHICNTINICIYNVYIYIFMNIYSNAKNLVSIYLWVQNTIGLKLKDLWQTHVICTALANTNVPQDINAFHRLVMVIISHCKASTLIKHIDPAVSTNWCGIMLIILGIKESSSPELLYSENSVS